MNGVVPRLALDSTSPLWGSDQTDRQHDGLTAAMRESDGIPRAPTWRNALPTAEPGFGREREGYGVGGLRRSGFTVSPFVVGAAIVSKGGTPEPGQ